jgi:hypothetical protein
MFLLSLWEFLLFWGGGWDLLGLLAWNALGLFGKQLGVE